jgi:endonuclease III
MRALTPRRIERAIYPVGFYRTKARAILEICDDLLARFGGKVPDEIDDLLTLGGVGRKTANLVVGQNVCTPVSPRCSVCPVRALCPRIGVTSSR